MIGQKHQMLTDTEVEEVRDQLYALADATIITLFKKFYLVLFRPADFIVVSESTFVAIVDT